MAIAPVCFLWPSFCRSFPGSQLCRISENARWGSPWQICHSSALRALWAPRFAAKCCARLALQVHPNKDRMAFAPGFFVAFFLQEVPRVATLQNFRKRALRVSLANGFTGTLRGAVCSRISENARWGSPWQICHSSALRALWEPQFAAKCSAVLAL